MAEPQMSTLGAATGLTTALLGAQVDALVLGLTAAIFISVWMDTIDNKIKAGSAALLSALVAGYGAPKAAAFVASTWPAIGAPDDALRLLMAVLIGAGAPVLIPIGIKLLKGRAGQ